MQGLRFSLFLLITAVFILIVWRCDRESLESDTIPTREGSLPDDAIKVTPERDVFPPVLHSSRWSEPVPLEGPINTAGVEDSPFITLDGRNLYFFFTPDVNAPPEKQLLDKVTGIWWSRKINGRWTEPERVILSDGASIDGAVFVQFDTMWFASVRSGNYGEIDFYTAIFKDGRWTEVKNAGRQLNEEYDIGELHITPDGLTMYCDKPGINSTKKDIYILHRVKDGWTKPEALPAPVNSAEQNESQPFITSDGSELWFTGESKLGYPGPAIFRCVRQPDGTWGKPEEIISQFAGEPVLDEQGNIYFVHHFFSREMKMIEADIYVAYRK
jgi:hypothetical protein